MRIFIGLIASVVWILIMSAAVAKTGIAISEDLQWLTTAIVFAGAMAGGDG